MSKDFEKRKDAIWAKWEKAKGIHVPEDLRKKWEKAASDMYYSEPDMALSELGSYIEERLDDLKYLAITNYFSSHKKPKGSTGKKRYHQPFENRLYLVEFVMSRHLMTVNRDGKSLDWRKRIDWKQMSVEWNEAHPNDHVSATVLKLRYYRAIAEEAIQQEYIERSSYRVPMNVGAEVYDYAKITDSEGNYRIGNIGSIRRQFENGKFTMAIRLVGDELSSEESFQDAKRASRLLKLSTKWLKAKTPGKFKLKQLSW